MTETKPYVFSNQGEPPVDAHGPLYSGYHNTYKKHSTPNHGHSVHQQEACDIHKQRRFSLRQNQATERRASRSERRQSESPLQTLAVDLSEGTAQSEMKRDSVSSMVSMTSTATILPNPYNRFNHHVHAVSISPCCMVFFLICCLPAVRTMNRSDRFYQIGDDEKAKVYARRATFLFFFGIFLTLLMGGVILFFAVYFTTRKN